MKKARTQTKRILSVLLVLLMVTVTIPSAFAGDTDYQVGDHIQFGTYPQSQVTDETLIASLDAADKVWASYEYYTGTGFDGLMSPGDWMRFADFYYEGEKYRAVVFSQFRPYLTIDISSIDRTYQDENGYSINTTYYFKYEPLSWRVLDPSSCFVLCENIIDAQTFQNVVLKSGSEYYIGFSSNYANNYALSTIRIWLNDDFYNTAFNNTQKAMIKSTSVNNNAFSTSYSQFDAASTTDPIFLLSSSDVENSSYGFSSAFERQAEGTEYAKCQGLYSKRSAPFLGCSGWKLRTAGKISYSTRNIFPVDYPSDDPDIADYGCVCYLDGVRPACCLTELSDNVAISEALYSMIKHENQGHIPGDVVIENNVDSTCTEDGSYDSVSICTVCCAEIREHVTVPTNGHTYVDHTAQAPTCTAIGWDAYQTCENCDYTSYVEIPATGHDVIVKGGGDATCTNEGYTGDEFCSVCDEKLSEGHITPAKGHTTALVNAKEVTATEDGYTGDEVCFVCGQTVKAGEVIPATGESASDEPVSEVTDDTSKPAKGDFFNKLFSWLIELFHMFTRWIKK